MPFRVDAGEYFRYPELAPPLTEADLGTPGPTWSGVIVDEQLPDDQLARLGDWMGRHPGMGLRLGGAEGPRPIRDLEMLRFFPTVTRIAVGNDGLHDLTGLRYVTESLTSLSISVARGASIEPLERFTHLRSLQLSSHVTHLTSLYRLRSLVDLDLYAINPMRDLEGFREHRELRSLRVSFGGIKDLSALPDVGRIRRLELIGQRGLADLAPIARTSTLEHLELSWLRQVTRLPDLSSLTRLYRLRLDTMKGLHDLAPLLTAPALQHVELVDLPQLDPQTVIALNDHPSLRGVSTALCHAGKQTIVEANLRVPRSHWMAWRDYEESW